jgi:hypothetical protein
MLTLTLHCSAIVLIARQIGVTQQRAQQTQSTFLGGTFAAAFSALERNHHEEDVIGPRCGRDFGPFRSPARLCWSAHLSRTRWLSVLVGLCRCPGWKAGPPLLLGYPGLLGRLCLAQAPRAHLRLTTERASQGECKIPERGARTWVIPDAHRRRAPASAAPVCGTGVCFTRHVPGPHDLDPVSGSAGQFIRASAS